MLRYPILVLVEILGCFVFRSTKAHVQPLLFERRQERIALAIEYHILMVDKHTASKTRITDVDVLLAERLILRCEVLVRICQRRRNPVEDEVAELRSRWR